VAPGDANTPRPLIAEKSRKTYGRVCDLSRPEIGRGKKAFSDCRENRSQSPRRRLSFGRAGHDDRRYGSRENSTWKTPPRATSTFYPLRHLVKFTSPRGNLTVAQSALEAALKSAPNTWRADQFAGTQWLSNRLLFRGDGARRTRPANGEETEAKGARLTLADVFVRNGRSPRSVQVLNELLKENPTTGSGEGGPQVVGRQAANRRLRRPPPMSLRPRIWATRRLTIAPSLSAANLPSALSNPLNQSPRWLPGKCG